MSSEAVDFDAVAAAYVFELACDPDDLPVADAVEAELAGGAVWLETLDEVEGVALPCASASSPVSA